MPTSSTISSPAATGARARIDVVEVAQPAAPTAGTNGASGSNRTSGSIPHQPPSRGTDASRP